MRNFTQEYCVELISIITTLGGDHDHRHDHDRSRDHHHDWKTLSSSPKGVLMIIAKYAEPKYDKICFRFGGYSQNKHESRTRTDIIPSSFRLDIDSGESDKRHRWIKLADMSYARKGATASLYSKTSHIFVCGGIDSNLKRLNSMERYSILNDAWEPIGTAPSMRVCRFFHASVECDGSIFVTGGVPDNKDLSSCEVFNIEKNEWSDLPDMLIARSQHGSVADTIKKCVYVIGGHENNRAERYNITTGIWSEISPIPLSRASHTSVILSLPSINDTVILSMFNVTMSMSNSVFQYSINENK